MDTERRPSNESRQTSFQNSGYDRSMKIAFVIFVITAVPIVPNFGLIFHDALQLHNSLVSIIMLITTNLIVSMLFSIIAAPLILIIGYRTVAILSGFLLTLGIVGAAMLIGTEYPFTMLMFWYGFVTPIGFGLGGSVYPMSLNTYFKERRIKIYNFSMIMATIVLVAYPSFVASLIYFYETSDCILIVGGITCNVIVGAFLIQSRLIRSHRRYVNEIVLNEIDANSDAIEMTPPKKGLPRTRKFSIDETSRRELPLEDENYEKLITRKISVQYEQTTSLIPKKPSVDTEVSQVLTKVPVLSLETLWMQGSVGVFGELPIYVESQHSEIPPEDVIENSSRNFPMTEFKSKPKWHQFTLITSKLFDFAQLRDKTLLNIMAGMSMVTVGEMMYLYLQPFIVFDFVQCSPIEMAIFLGAQYMVELIWRILAHFYLNEYLLDESARAMCIVSWSVGIMAKTFMLIVTHYNKILIVSILMGLTRGLRQVYMARAISERVTQDQLSSVGVLQMLFNLIAFIVIGPFLGAICYFTSSYAWCLIFLNCLTGLSITMWTLEFAYCRYRRNHDRNKDIAILSHSNSSIHKA